MRIRSIKPEFWASESVGRLDHTTRLLFVGLWSLSDDEGRFRANPAFIAGQIFPYDGPEGLASVRRGLARLLADGKITLYMVGESHYGAVLGWSEHQRIDRPSKSKLPAPEDGQPLETKEQSPESSNSMNPREASSSPLEPSCQEQGTGSREGNREQGAPSARVVEQEALELSSEPPTDAKPQPVATPPKSKKAPTPRATPPKPAPTPEGTHQALRDALCATFEAVRGVPYRWDYEIDGSALKALLKTETEAEIRARWERGVKAGERWPGVLAFRQLRAKWNDLAPPPPSRLVGSGPVKSTFTDVNAVAQGAIF